MAAFADWLDARAAIVHEWHAQGVSVEEIVDRLSPEESDVRTWLRTAPLPLPGSSRSLVAELRRRVAELETALHFETTPTERPPPTDSEVRALTRPPEEG